ncbi:zinc finger protein jing homolog [Diachasmimorpha longicaudata]|uniref:zinc finger protein jing homolog n=1 Tax=Diachasmimorpha longicaudata TaxID=58733 RepID=UPI0030B8F8E9
MADWRSPAEEAAATDLCDESRVPRERHKKRVVEHQSPLTALVVHHLQHQAFVLDTSCCNDKSDTSASDNSRDVDNVERCNGVMSDGLNVDCLNKRDNNDIVNVYMVNGKAVNVKGSNVPLNMISGDDKLLVNGDCDRKLVIERCTTKMPDDGDEGIVVLGGVAGKSDGGDCVSDVVREVGDGGVNVTVVDAAAAAVAVSAIPETMKEIKQSKHTDGNGSELVARLGSPYKGQIRTAEDTLVGPCGKKRCADRYDSSESSDSGVAISCGECSSSGTSDITEPGSPCSTSSDEGVAIGGAAASSPLPSLPKLAPATSSMHNGTRPQWPWAPPLAATACSAYKTHKGEPEIGTLPKVGAADPTARAGKTTQLGKQQNHQEHQGKITEYFKTQIKPQQLKAKKPTAEMSVMIAKNSSEFRRPPTVQRNKGGLAKYLGVVTPNGRIDHDWEVRTMTVSPPLTRKLPTVSPRVSVTKLDKKLISKSIPGFPISSEVLSSIPSCKISSLRLTSEASPNASSDSPLSPPTPNHQSQTEPVATIEFESTAKPTVNENNNVTICSGNHINNKEHPLSWMVNGLLDKREEDKPRTTSRIEEDEEEEEEDSSRSSESKPSTRSSESSSPILTAPTTIRFPARAPAKSSSQTNDSGVCRWDKCNANFECSGLLLEHLQVAHINTQTGGDNFVCHWQGCKVKGRTSCSRRWLERHVLSHGGNKPFRCIVDGCGSRFSSQPALERHVNSHFNQPETSTSNSRRSCENGGKLVRRNGKKLRYRRQPWSARLFDYFDTGVMEGLQHRLLELAKTRTQGLLAETPGNSMTLTSQVLARRIEKDGKTKVLVRWYPQDIEPDEWLLESEVQSTKHIQVRKAATTSVDEVSLVLYPAINGGSPPTTRVKQRRKPVKNS